MLGNEYRPKKQLFKRPVPIWLKNINSLRFFPVEDVLSDSVYYPASNDDYYPIYAYSGFSHSFIYVDPHIRIQPEYQKLRGYKLSMSREVLKEELCYRPYQALLPTENDGDLVKLKKMSFLLESAGNSGKPFALWQIYDRIESFNWGDPERISVLRITGEGIATYQALFFSNQVKPLLIFNKCCTCCTWSIFEERGGFFNRTVLANPAGIPNYMASWDSLENSVWDGYKRRIESKKFFPVWIADDLDLENHYLHKPSCNL